MINIDEVTENQKLKELLKKMYEINGKDLYIYSYYKDAPKGRTVDAQVGYTCLFANGLISN